MIRFAHPFILIAIPAAIALLVAVVRRPAVVLRAVVVSLVLTALAEPLVLRERPQESVLFLVDRSASVARTEPEERIQAQIDRLAVADPARRYGLIEFGRSATLTVPFSADAPRLGSSTVDAESTRIGPAVDAALSILPEEGARQVILLTDGRFSDDLDAAIATLQFAGLSVSVIPVGRAASADAAVVALSAPAQVPIGRPFVIDIDVSLPPGEAGVLAVYRDDELLVWDSIDDPGYRRYSIEETRSEPGPAVYQAVLRYPGDPIPENDRLSALVTTTDRPSILVVDPGGDAAVPALLDALGLSYTEADAVPSVEVLSQFPQVVLTGTPLAALTAETVAALGTFVRDLGGGLVVVEGESEVRGFGGGSIETLLPVSYSTPETGQEASLAIAFVLDRSASMKAQAGPAGLPKIEILKESAAASVQLLDPSALVGLLVFNREHEWALPLQPVGDATDVYDALRPLTAIGGTDIYYPLVEALDRLEAVEARSKHVLLISDGRTSNEIRDYPGLLARLERSAKITLSAIAVGATPNLPLLTALVESGGGALYRASDVSTLPQVSVRATQRLSQRRFVTGTIGLSGPLSRLPGGAMIPPLRGYVVSDPRPSAEVELWAGSDPIVATWRIGRGSVTALNTDLNGRWSADWIAWPDAPALFDQILRPSQPDAASIAGFTAHLEFGEDETVLLIDARTPDGEFADFLEFDGALLPGPEPLHIDQIAPGLYLASFPTPAEGGYAVRIEERSRARGVVVPFSVPYSSEYRSFGVNARALHQIAQRTGGRLLADGDLLPLSATATTAAETSLAPSMLIAALVLFLVELAARKIPRFGRRADGPPADPRSPSPFD